MAIAVQTALLLLAATVSHHEPSLLKDVPIPPGATAVSRHRLDDLGEQLSFAMKAAYPSAHVFDHFQTYFAAAGFSPCTRDGDQWEVFLQLRPDGSEQQVHQLMRYWADRRGLRMATIVLRYTDLVVDGAVPLQPRTDSQKVDVIVRRDQRDLDEQLQLLQVDCPVEEGQ